MLSVYSSEYWLEVVSVEVDLTSRDGRAHFESRERVPALPPCSLSDLPRRFQLLQSS